jgi:hypothetical protein
MNALDKQKNKNIKITFAREREAKRKWEIKSILSTFLCVCVRLFCDFLFK